MTGRRFEELGSLFAKASRLETDFWQMGLDATGLTLTASETHAPDGVMP